MINIEEIIKKLVDLLTDFGIKLILAVILLVVGIKLSKWFSKKMYKSRALSNLDDGVRKFIANAIKITLYILIIISAAGILKIPYASFVAVLGSAGVAIGLALQGSLSNIASGILILVNKPFRVGDFIKVGEMSGTVRDIGFFSTSIVTGDNCVVSYPNSTLSNSCIVNYFAKPTRRIDMTFSVSYSSDIEKVKATLLETAHENSMVLDDPAPFAGVSNHAESAVEFLLRFWCKSEDFWYVKYSVAENVKNAFDKNGIEIPFPQLDVSLKK